MARIIYCCGPDGSGKSTYLRDIDAYLKNQGYITTNVWIRSPKILCKPLMVYCHLTGLTKYQEINGCRYGTHSFEKSPLVKKLYPILQLIDFKIKWHYISTFKIKKADFVLLDRFVLDTLVDIMVSTKRLNLHETRIGSLFLNMLPKTAVTMLFIASPQIIRKRKLDTVYDGNLELKVRLFNDLGRILGIHIIDNDRPYLQVRTEVLQLIV